MKLRPPLQKPKIGNDLKQGRFQIIFPIGKPLLKMIILRNQRHVFPELPLRGFDPDNPYPIRFVSQYP